MCYDMLCKYQFMDGEDAGNCSRGFPKPPDGKCMIEDHDQDAEDRYCEAEYNGEIAEDR